MNDTYSIIRFNIKTRRMETVYDDIHDWETALTLAKVAIKENNNDIGSDTIIFVDPGKNNMSKSEYDEAKKLELAYRKRDNKK